MGWLAAQGAIMAIGLFIGLVCSVIGLFFGHIILFDSIALGIAAGVCCNQFTAIHPALCLVIGIATFLLLLWLQNTRISFWLVGGLLVLCEAIHVCFARAEVATLHGVVEQAIDAVTITLVVLCCVDATLCRDGVGATS